MASNEPHLDDFDIAHLDFAFGTITPVRPKLPADSAG